MFMYTAKVTKFRIIVFILAVAIIISAIIMLIPNEPNADETLNEQMLEATMASITVSGIETNDDRIIFLNEKGLEVSETEIDKKTIQIPSEFNETYEKYNELQKMQGFDLSKFQGKTVELYVYEVLNYPDTEEEIHANILIYKNKIIGGDVSSVNIDGFIEGFSKETLAG